MKPHVIAKFDGEYEFLSNFYTMPFNWRNMRFTTAEHAFQAAKALHDKQYVKSMLAASSPGKAKRLGRAVKIDVKEWDQRKDQMMREIIHCKFRDGVMAAKLINTGSAMLVEGNTWGDTYWGRCNGKGFNKLGAILMEERGYWLHSNFEDRTPNVPQASY